MIKTVFINIIIALVFFSNSQAWNGRGHMIMASITYNKLSPADRDSALTLLKNHPDYETVWKNGYNGWENDVSFGTYIFMKASIWADEIKWKGNPNHRMNESEWHYVTYKIQFPDKHDTTLNSSSKQPDVVWAIENAKNIINDKKESLKTRAIYLAWLIHLVGDVHQPMHCASLFNDTYTDGDKGGNRIYFKYGKSTINLHSLWDNVLGKSKQYKGVVEYANEISEKNTSNNLQFENNPRKWSIESFELAIKEGHLDGNLKGSDSKETDILIPEKYAENMKNVSEKQIYISAIRLAHTIEELNF
ncbi:MAG: hypothetical protein A2W98_12110 [Bacteroidetes bacterium GWF2_33_38]|nr:MAG: hypothetical protein A2W98_12110 [Bacteroidetes bacterium GWF2_33_38]OFY68327.1 MAG: hypothetical protein A2265_11170 [Bacteroidetes bacterium RIFOXYA12_FULL_33_9]OFY86943.1 MAG: hypothetical protein A2236_07405 [Bacteroidetes bacterium RIFOXYA2_FULL_33_7]